MSITGFAPLPEPPPNGPPSSRGHRGATWARIALIVFGFVLLGGLAFLQYQRNRELDERLADLQRESRELHQQAREAAKTSRMAQSRAAEAEENARQAARGRVQAEQASEESALAAEQARQQADAASAEAQVAREELERVRQEREAELARLEKALGQIAETQRSALGLVMTLGSDSVKFDFDKADLRPENRELLARIAGVLLTAHGFRIQVYGHTDDIGTDGYNQGLSERRAQSVRDYLVQSGVDPEVISTKGFGKSSPRVRDRTEEARAKNRRVEIAVVDSIIDYKGEVARKAF